MGTGNLLEIQDLHVNLNDVPVLNGVNLTIRPGEVHAVMGPNGSGKSTLAKVITGHPDCKVTQGTASYKDQDLLLMPPDLRAQMGIFMSFQHPVEIPGLRLDHFMRAGFNEVQKSKGLGETDVLTFDKLLKGHIDTVGIDYSLTKRSVNDGFSGGEKKRSEILQMAVLGPSLSILDEIDSGLDVDALRAVATGINESRGPDRSVILVTHYQRILDHVIPDVVHIFVNGRIAMTGDKNLALQVESRGYDWVESSQGLS